MVLLSLATTDPFGLFFSSIVTAICLKVEARLNVCFLAVKVDEVSANKRCSVEAQADWRGLAGFTFD